MDRKPKSHRRQALGFVFYMLGLCVLTMLQSGCAAWVSTGDSRDIHTYDQDYWNAVANKYYENDHNMVLKSYKRRYDGDEKSQRRAYEYDFLRQMQR